MTTPKPDLAARRWSAGTLAFMGPTTSQMTPDDEPRPWGRRVLVAAVVVGVVVVVVTVKVRWWRRGGPRRAVKGLAEAGAVALADTIVDELLPAA